MKTQPLFFLRHVSKGYAVSFPQLCKSIGILLVTFGDCVHIFALFLLFSVFDTKKVYFLYQYFVERLFFSPVNYF